MRRSAAGVRNRLEGRRARLHVFSPGARVLIDGRYEAVVRQAFPEGSTSFLFPHYKLDLVGGDRNVAVSMTRVGVVRRA